MSGQPEDPIVVAPMPIKPQDDAPVSDSTPPNVLVIMADEHAPRFSATYGHPLVRTPNMDRLARDGVTFDAAYCNSPLCVPSRMSFMTGRYVHDIRTYDNASPLASDTPTWAHALGSCGYQVWLAGKQHFIGPDQLHGFHAQLARDLHAEIIHELCAWDDGITARRPWRHVSEAGPGTTTELETDDAVELAAVEAIQAGGRSGRPWALTASFIAPHFPFVAPSRYWDMYPLGDIDMPLLPEGHLTDQHPVYQRLREQFGVLSVPEEQVRRARAGYYALVTYLDDKIGRLLEALEQSGQADNTVVIYAADHGEMNGEHGLWRKSCFYEESVRVPLIIRWPGRLPGGRRVAAPVSLVDVARTIVDVAGADPVPPMAGDSLVRLARGDDDTWKGEAFSEYVAHGVIGPMAMLRRGRYKLNYSHGERAELYDVVDDPHELRDLACEKSWTSVVAELRDSLLRRWDPVALDRAVRRSQRARLLIRSSGPPTW